MGTSTRVNMADRAPASGGDRGGFRGGFGDRGRGGRGRGRGRGRGGGRGGRGKEEKDWVPVTKLGRLVKDGKIKKLEQIYLFSMPIKEFVIIGDSDGHVGLGVKSAKEVATAIRGAIIAAKINVVPVMRGYWGNRIGEPHTIPCKVSGKCGSIKIRLIPAPRGTGLVAAKIPKKVLQYAGVDDCFTSSRGATSTGGNFVKAVFAAVKATYAYNFPELWEQADLAAKKPPFQEFTDHLKKAEIKAPVVKTYF